PHLSGRREIIRLADLQLRNDNGEVVKVDYAIADLWRLQRYQIAFKHDGQRLRSLVNMIDRVTNTNEYGIIGFKDGVILMQKGVASNPEAMAAWLRFREELEV
ncbi:MAG: DUF2079 domain-containing protein, partial [Moorea sp. SIO2I5]|nr:DUF2079 domain-containing protein [Moorena sp. SIO2I5]